MRSIRIPSWLVVFVAVVCATAYALADQIPGPQGGVLPGTTFPASSITGTIGNSHLPASPHTFTLFVDPAGTGTADGSSERPYTTLQAAIGYANSNASSTDSWTVFAAPGTYTENLSVTGTYGLTLFSTGALTVNGTVTVTSASGAFGTLNFVTPGAAAQSSIGALTLTGGDGTSGFQFLFAGFVMSTVTTTGFGGSTSNSVTIFAQDSIFQGALNSPQALLSHALNTRFLGLLTVNQYRTVVACRIKNGMTCTAAPATTSTSNVLGIYGTRVSGTLTGPSASYLLDDASTYWFFTTGATLSGGATRVYTGRGALVVAPGRVTGSTGAVNLSTFTVGPNDGSFEVSANMNVTAAASISTSLSCAYTDETGTLQTMIFPIQQGAGTFVAAGAITGTGPWETPVMHLRCKASTTISISVSSGTFSSVTYNAEGIIKETQ